MDEWRKWDLARTVFLVYRSIARCLINAPWRRKKERERGREGGILQISLSFELRAQLEVFSNIFVFTTSSIVPGTH